MYLPSGDHSTVIDPEEPLSLERGLRVVVSQMNTPASLPTAKVEPVGDHVNPRTSARSLSGAGVAICNNVISRPSPEFQNLTAPSSEVEAIVFPSGDQTALKT